MRTITLLLCYVTLAGCNQIHRPHQTAETVKYTELTEYHNDGTVTKEIIHNRGLVIYTGPAALCQHNPEAKQVVITLAGTAKAFKFEPERKSNGPIGLTVGADSWVIDLQKTEATIKLSFTPKRLATSN